MAIASLVLAIMAWFCGHFVFSVPAVILAKIELGRIERGESSPDGRVISQVGFWLAVANIVVMGLVLCGYAAFIGVMIAASSRGY